MSTDKELHHAFMDSLRQALPQDAPIDKKKRLKEPILEDDTELLEMLEQLFADLSTSDDDV